MINDPTNPKMQVEAKSELNARVSSIDQLEKLTPKLIDKLWILDQDRVYFPNLKVPFASLDQWLEENSGKLDVDVEYFSETDVTDEFWIKFAPSRFGGICASVFSHWFQDIAEESGISDRVYGAAGCSTHYFDQEASYLIKPDAELADYSQDEPIIALEIGVTQSLEDLFQVAKRLLSPPNGNTKLVIIVKIYETDRGAELDPPWGLELHDLLQKLKYNTLHSHIAQHHRQQDEPLVGSLSAHVYLWAKDMKNPTPYPACEFGFGSGSGRQQRVFRITRTFCDEYLDDEEHALKIWGGSFDFPFKKLGRALRNVVPGEELRRASLVIARHEDYLRSLAPCKL